MSSEAQNVIADVIGKHRPIDSRDGEDGLCSCGWQEGVRWGPPTCAEHLAEEIDKALGGLTRETVREQVPYGNSTAGVMPPAPNPRTGTRWVSGWSEA
ncbi:hypothetical protein SEA_YEET_69 [Mycobacterium phage Yeet]|uniref:Uncharacterized protein n=2 Tax=root TaxID=1 RepID=A0A2D2W474_9CAUD|nr:hypothetical protein [Acinetobacter baumannii]YP_008410226.1 hypothetical protein N860_gp068 [Mycobacterium phage Redno2]YP_008410464.1 hypothetical protein N857_gp075 [Mycobacterium phage Wanda]YP_009124030.1 hypothetical protein VC71_gp077 [Mycobacterium phage Minerva]ASD53462.1 hypothetical protein PBI_LUCKY2013_69 [Mycobacterium phage Lucky2013]ATN88879.1 hypothetical protein SEA_DMPSTRDIVER_71 [Mycobacterium phage DmpstrDiver]ATN89786.1 hypothetical protein SEA_KLEIN_71 [Mycobacterium